jgi:hypothetical protein
MLPSRGYDLKLEGLGQINLLVGVNNSGKTSVLEAISLYCSSLNLREWISIARQRDQEGKIWYRVSPLDALIWLFPHYSGLDNNELYKGEISMASQGAFLVKRLSATCEVIEGIKSPDKEQINQIKKTKYCSIHGKYFCDKFYCYNNYFPP